MSWIDQFQRYYLWRACDLGEAESCRALGGFLGDEYFTRRGCVLGSHGSCLELYVGRTERFLDGEARADALRWLRDRCEGDRDQPACRALVAAHFRHAQGGVGGERQMQAREWLRQQCSDRGKGEACASLASALMIGGRGTDFEETAQSRHYRRRACLLHHRPSCERLSCDPLFVRGFPDSFAGSSAYAAVEYSALCQDLEQLVGRPVRIEGRYETGWEVTCRFSGIDRLRPGCCLELRAIAPEAIDRLRRETRRSTSGCLRVWGRIVRPVRGWGYGKGTGFVVDHVEQTAPNMTSEPAPIN